MKGIQLANIAKSSDLVKSKKKTMTAALEKVCAPVVGPRVPSFCRPPWSPPHLSPIGPLLRTCSRCHSLPVGSPSPRPKNKLLLVLAVLICKTKLLVQD